MTITGFRGSRRPGSDWSWSDVVETSDEVLLDLFNDLVNDDESDVLGVDVAIRDNDGVVHVLAKAAALPADLLPRDS